jgi:hypothetical protein
MNNCIVCNNKTKNKYCSRNCFFDRAFKYTLNGYSIEDNTAVFKTTNGNFLIDIDDLDKVKHRLWHFTQSNGVISNKRRGEKKPNSNGHIKLHRLIMDAPKNKVVDHINGDRRDNRKSNLRVVDQWANMINRSSGKMRNIERRTNSKTLCVRITKNKKKYYIGNYATVEEAILARDEAAKRIHGEYRKR